MPRSIIILLLVSVLLSFAAGGTPEGGDKSDNLVLKSSDMAPRTGRVLIYEVTRTGNGVTGKDTLAVTCAGTAPIPAVNVKSAFVLRSPLFEAYQELTGNALYYHRFTFTKVVKDEVKRSWVREKRLSFPLKVGSEWEGGDTPVVFGVKSRLKVTKTNLYRVVTEEKIEVPAGGYQCLKVEKKIRANGLPPEFEERYKRALTESWYAKGVGLVKRVSVDPNTGVVETRVLTGMIEPAGDVPKSALAKISLPELKLQPGRIHFYKYSEGGYRGWIETSASTLQTFHGDFGTGNHTVKYSRKKDAWIQNGKHPYSLDGPVARYRFPIEAGKEWQGRGGREPLARKAAGVEVIGTPFRSYVAMKIETRDKSGKIVFEEWVVPGTGIVKQVLHRAQKKETYELEYLLEKVGSKSQYTIPFKGEPRKCVNAWAIGPSRTSHRGWERFAADFYGEKGTPVYTAREGTVVELKEDSKRGGNDDKYIADANYVIVRHADNTYALYLHLQNKSVPVEVGDTVERRRRIGKIGVTGWTTGPHLHFHVHNGITTLPVAFADIPSNYGIPERGKTYTPR